MPGANQDNLPDFRRGETLPASKLQALSDAGRQKRLAPGTFQSGSFNLQRPVHNPNKTTHWGVVAEGGISALSGVSGSTLTIGEGNVQAYNSDGTIQSGVIEVYKAWLTGDVPEHTPVMGDEEPDGTIWLRVAPCDPLPSS